MAKTASKSAKAGNGTKKRYEVLVPYDYEHKGEMKTGWTRVGVAFQSGDGEGFNIELRPGIAVNGRVVVRPAKEKTGDPDDDLI